MNPVEVVPMLTAPEPLASIDRASLVPEEIADNATPPAAAALLTLMPVAALAVEASTTKVGLVAPAGPTAKAVAEVEVITPRAATAEPPIVVPAGNAQEGAPLKSTALAVFNPLYNTPGSKSSK
jgi:anti-sigma factor RsiW